MTEANLSVEEVKRLVGELVLVREADRLNYERRIAMLEKQLASTAKAGKRVHAPNE